MNLRQLATFDTVARTLSLSQAADQLSYAQSTVTAQIQALEKELSVPLFARLGKRITGLTPAGESLAHYAQRMLALEAEMQAAFSDTSKPTGTLTIGASETVLTYRLPPLLTAFRKHYPEVQLVMRPFHYGELLDQVRQGTIDLAFVFDQPLQVSRMHTECLIEERMLLVATPDHPLAQLEQVLPLDLETETILFTEVSCGYRTLFEQTLLSNGVRPSTNLEFNSLEAIKQCVIAGLGITLVPEVSVTRELELGKLVALPWGGDPLHVFTQLMWHDSRWESPALQTMLQLSRDMLVST